MDFPYDGCRYRKEAAKESGIELNCANCDLPDLLKDDSCAKKNPLAKEILDLYYILNSPIVERFPQLADFAFSSMRPELGQMDAQVILYGLNIIEKEIQDYKRAIQERNQQHVSNP